MKVARCATRARVIGAAVASVLAGLQYTAEGAVFVYKGPGPGGTAAAPVSGNWNDAAHWVSNLIPVSEGATELQFGGSGGTAYTSTNDLGAFSLNILRLNSTATVPNTIAGLDSGHELYLVNNGGTAATILNQGSGSFLISAGIVLSGTSAVTFGGTGTGTVTLAGPISGAAALTINNSRYTFANAAGDNSYTGLTTISAGTVTASAGAAGVGAVAIGGNLTISGTGSLTYTNPNQVVDSATVTVSGGTLALGANSDTIGILSTSGGTVSGTGGVLTVDQVNTTGGTISAIVAGSGGLLKTGTGTTTLTGANTFIGTVDSRGGNVLVQGAAGSIAGASSVVLGFDLPGTLTLNNVTNNNNDRLGDTAGLTFNRAGGTLSLAGNAAGTAEVIGAVSVNAIGTVTVTSTSGGSVQLTAESLSRSTGGAIDFRGVGGTLGSAGGNPRVVFTTPPVAAAGDLVGGWATVNGADFATHDPVTGIKAFTAYTPLPASGFSPTTVYAAGGNVTLTGSGNVLALKLGTETAQTINLGANTLTVDGGGIVSSGAGVTTINGTGALVLPNEGVITVGQGTVVVNAPLDTPTLIKPGAGRLAIALSGTNPAAWMSGGVSFSGELELNTTADQTFTGTLVGSGTLVKSGTARVILQNSESSFATFRIDQGVLEAQALNGNIEFNNTSQTNHLGSNNTGAVTINGGTLKLSTPDRGGSAGNIQLNRAITFTASGGTIDLTNEFGGTLGGTATTVDGIAFGGGSGSLPITTSGSSNAAAAVIKWNGGQAGLSRTQANDQRDWNTGENTLKFSTLAGTGQVRVELSNGAGVRVGTNPGGTATSTTPMPFTIAGPTIASGGDPTSGPAGTANSGIAKNTGRIMHDGLATIVYTNGLFLEGALQTGAQGAARAIDGNITLRGIASGNPAYMAFNGRSTGTALGATIQNPGQNAAGINPLYVGVGRNDTLTIEDGAIGVMDLRIRTDQGNHNGVFLDARTLLHAGGTLQFRQSISNFTNTDTAVISAANVGFHRVRNDIEGRGTTARESVVDLYLPFDNDVATASPLGGVEFHGTNVALIVNGTGLGGMRVNGLARPGVLLDGTATGVDPVGNDAKVANLLSPERLAALTGAGGYLTPAPAGATFAFPAAGQWAAGVNVGLRAANSNTNGADVALPAGAWAHGLHVDAGAEMVVTGVTVSNGKVSGAGTLTSGAGANGLTVAAGASVAPGDGAALPGKLTSAGDVTFQAGSSLAVRVNGQAAGTGYGQLDATGNAVTLAGNLAIAKDAAFNPTPYVALAVLPYATRTGQFATVTGMEAGNNLLFAAIYEADGVKLIPALPGDATVDRSVDFNDLVKLAQNYNSVGQSWATGDFTGDGSTDFNDLVKLAQNYNTRLLPSDPVPGAPSNFSADLAAAFAAVPEPSSALAVVAAGALAGLRRRRRRTA